MTALRLELLELDGDGSQVVAGEATLDAEGRAVFDVEHAYLAKVPVIDPTQPGRQLSPDDGERYLRALTDQLTEPYLRARLIED